jgi:hypothetical protein
LHPASSISRVLKSPALWLLLFLSVALPAMSLTGRYGGVPHFDLCWDTMNAHRMLAEGTIPEHGCVSGLYSFNPPGITYGFLPGMLIFPHRPVAAERVGAALLFVGTLCGLFLLIYPRLGGWAASGTLLVFSFASGGVFYLTTLWPRGHVFFAVWILLFATLWVERRRSRWLAAALVTYAAGMYWFMEIAPLIVLLPALWLLYRPPVRLRGMLIAAALSLILWMPYLRFEAGRGFADLRSLLTVTYPEGDFSVQKAVSDPSHKLVHSWDVPRLRAEAAGRPLPKEPESGGFWLFTREWGWVWALRDKASYLGEDGFSFCTMDGEWFFQGFASGRILKKNRDNWEKGSHLVDYPGRETKGEVRVFEWRVFREKLRSAGPFFQLGDQQKYAFFFWQLGLFLAALAGVFVLGKVWRLPREALTRWRDFFRREAAEPGEVRDGRVLFVVLFLAWILPVLFLCFLTGWEGLFTGQRRFYWLWAVQAPILGCVLSLPLWRGWRPGFVLLLAATFTLSQNPLTKSLFRDAFSAVPGHWLRSEDKAIDALSAAIRAQGHSAARIGYDTNQERWFTELRNLDGVSKCGIPWDVSLFLRHGIVNLDTSPEGLSADDDFRVFSPLYEIPRSDFAQFRWSMTIDGSLPQMEKIAEAGGYEILKKKP